MMNSLNLGLFRLMSENQWDSLSCYAAAAARLSFCKNQWGSFSWHNHNTFELLQEQLRFILVLHNTF